MPSVGFHTKVNSAPGTARMTFTTRRKYAAKAPGSSAAVHGNQSPLNSKPSRRAARSCPPATSAAARRVNTSS